jgi:hypothetical protein
MQWPDPCTRAELPPLGATAQVVIDRLLGRAAELFPATEPDIELSGGAGPAAPVPTTGAALTARVEAAGEQWSRARAAVRRVDQQSGQLVGTAGETAAVGLRAAEQLREAARKQAAAILPLADSAAGMRLLVATMDARLAEMQARLKATTEANATTAGRLGDLADDYRTIKPLGSI